MDLKSLSLVAVFAPLAGALVAGLFCRVIARSVAHTAAIAGVATAFVAALLAFREVAGGARFNGTVYQWLTTGDYAFEVGFLIDPLTVSMMLVVTFVSLMVHIYTIGYMRDDPGYNRFFSYISLFTFSMLMLVMSNNFMQLFFGWEAVGLVSYLLIGFWYTRPTAIFANLKAFLVNRVGDFGFLLGIGLVLAYFGTLDYAAVFARVPALVGETIPLFGADVAAVSVITAICILLFIGAMGKSAQVPLHVWLPDSMEGPTPISALIHAATMVTAGIFMVARMSPLFELSDTALSFIVIIGAITALFMGFLGIIQNDIKRVVAYSTLSQLGYMTVALGVSAYPVAIFHLTTHAFFKALLFLAAGSVIMAMHHDQDIRRMGGLARYLPVTWITSLIGSLALIGTPLFAGFYSKDSIIEAVEASSIPGAGLAYGALLIGVFVTAFYSFRMFFLVFHGKERFGAASHGAGGHAAHDEHASHDEHQGLPPGEKPHESPWVVTLPLILLAIPSLLIGYVAIEPMLFGGWFADAILIDEVAHPGMRELAEHFHGAAAMALHGLSSAPFWLASSGVALAWFLYLRRPDLPAVWQARLGPLNTVLENKYYFDRFYETVFAGGARLLGRGFWQGGDVRVIDGFINGSARFVGWAAAVLRFLQSGRIYHYAFTMIFGLLVLMTLTLWVGRA
ncbi:NADH-quinone oxidoreductase subunit L [Rhodocyclus tenuis]|uniref:NADH-quinone oxidoreductase subunit L n=1 Tax=Rhodocyclus tenuis TaxID=1066 RepID=A0A6L5JX52_RHOTE|nr:NADH-quinone oxidoreductase subunit L [Rhodocyclus gracilis]MQY51150.1 NADH-quinone oxidoreductase subunit L [Rhodocyclus gracilis]MRD71966.1 NADH-quinone oxidoreductase subunit L [Rhodocyclus gracilis]